MIFGLWGEDKTAKTTLALTFPKPLVHMEYDVGGFARARHRFKEDVDSGQIISKIYPMPFQIGGFDPQKLAVRPSKVVVGMKELFYQWLADYMAHLQDKKLSTIVIDTATLLYEVCSMGYLQEKQEAQLDANGNLKDPRDKLLTHLFPPVLYKEINIRMRGIIYQAKAHGKHLVLTHHAKDVYGPVLRDGQIVQDKTGERERSGWTPLGDGADVIVHTYIKQEVTPETNPPQHKSVPYCKVELAETLELMGMEFKEPSYDKIQEAIRMMRGEA